MDKLDKNEVIEIKNLNDLKNLINNKSDNTELKRLFNNGDIKRELIDEYIHELIVKRNKRRKKIDFTKIRR